MRLKIISDGTLENTSVVNEKTGEQVEGVQEVQWSLGAAGPVAVIVLENPPVEIVAKPTKRNPFLGAGDGQNA